MPVDLLKASTRLSSALELHPDVLAYIVSLNPHDFERLRNPVMRRLMPPRISLARVAAIAEIPVNTLLEKLQGLTGVTADLEDKPQTMPQSSRPKPDWLEGLGVVKTVDLLPLDEHLEADPLPPVMNEVKKLQRGDVLLIRHKWEPQPFYDLWSKMPGLEWFTEQVSDDEWQIWVRRAE
jgi:hypothetical protein